MLKTNANQLSPMESYHMLLTINILRRRLRDRDYATYRLELAFYAQKLVVDQGWLQALAEDNTQPIRS